MPRKKVPLTNFKIHKIDNSKGDLDQLKQKMATPDFIFSDDLWIATFDLDGEAHAAGIARGRRPDVAEDIEQLHVQLRVRDEAYDADKFLAEWDVADITRSVLEEFAKVTGIKLHSDSETLT